MGASPVFGSVGLKDHLARSVGSSRLRKYNTEAIAVEDAEKAEERWAQTLRLGVVASVVAAIHVQSVTAVSAELRRVTFNRSAAETG